MALKGRSDSLIRAHPNGRKRRNLVIAGRSGEGPFTIRLPTFVIVHSQSWRPTP
jgi:hypothetical protein